MADVQIGPSIRAQLGKASPVIGRFEAMILLGFVIGKPREYLIAHDEAELTEDQILQFDMLVDMRAAGTPVPYLTGSQEFLVVTSMSQMPCSYRARTRRFSSNRRFLLWPGTQKYLT